jgi:hypothetical protein
MPPESPGGVWTLQSKVTVGNIAAQLAARMKESCSKSWLTGVMNRDPDRKARIEAARKVSAAAMLEEAIEIAGEPAEDTTAVQRNRLPADTRVRLASLFNREDFGSGSPVSVKLNIGQLHVDAMRRRTFAAQATAPQLGAGEELAEIIAEKD